MHKISPALVPTRMVFSLFDIAVPIQTLLIRAFKLPISAPPIDKGWPTHCMFVFQTFTVESLPPVKIPSFHQYIAVTAFIPPPPCALGITLFDLMALELV